MEIINGMSIVSSAVEVLNNCLGLKRQEKLLILTDMAGCELARSVMEAGKERCTEAVMVVIAPKKNAEEPSETIREWLTQFDAAIIISALPYKMAKLHQLTASARTRLIHIPFTESSEFARLLGIDWKRLGMFTRKCSALLNASGVVNVKSANGTDITFMNSGEGAVFDDGMLGGKKTTGTLPAGSAHVKVMEKSARGTLVLDSCRCNSSDKREPLVMQIEEGKIVSLKSESYKREIENLLSKDRKLKLLRGFGVGTHGAAQTTGPYSEHLISRGTVHFLFGQHKTAAVCTSFTGGICKPVVWFDNRLWIKEGRYV